jgi:transcriptional regulator with GAF, ATPase, and Fis domain
MPHSRNFEDPNRFQSQAVYLKVLSAIGQSANNAASTESVFRELGRQLLAFRMADAVSLIVYDQDVTRICELMLMTELGQFKQTNYHDLPLGGLSLSDTEVSDLTDLTQPLITMHTGTRDRLYKADGPLHFFTAYAQQLHLPLIHKKLPMGTLTLHGRTPDTFSPQNLPLFTILAGQLSMTMRLLAAEQEIRLVEEERNHLLALGKALTTVRDKKDLADVMRDQFRRLFPSGDIVICVVDHEKKTHSIFLFLPETGRYLTPSPVTSAIYPIDDGFYKQMLTAKNVRLFDVDDLIRQKKVPDYIRYLFDNGIRQIAGIGLSSGQTSIGALFVLCDRHQRLIPRQTIAMRAVSVHLSLAITNVLIKESYAWQLPPAAYPYETPALAEKISGMIGSSPVMSRIRQLIARVASSDSTILILGETGTGKELVAKAIHDNSTRRDKPMVKVNCAALPPALIESELFGHEKGSFTGAFERKIGKFELADNGTLFLDEIGELPTDLQVKLLRVLQEKEIERVGGTEVIRTDVRIVAATNRCLHKEVLAGRFRSDLFYRLNVLPIMLPPLRERKEDIPTLAAHFISKYTGRNGRKTDGLSGEALQALLNYHWPGNIRELEHLIERSLLLTADGLIRKIDIPVASHQGKGPANAAIRIRSLDEVGRDHILDVLKKCKGKVSGAGGAAQLLNIPSTTLNSRIKRLGIKKDFQL